MFTFVCGKAVNPAGLDDKNPKYRCVLRLRWRSKRLSAAQRLEVSSEGKELSMGTAWLSFSVLGLFSLKAYFKMEAL